MTDCHINNSPVEILIRIWSEYIHAENDHDCYNSFKLASVCRYWRSIILTTPQLWTRIHIRVSRLMDNAKAFRNQAKRIQLSLRRNPSAPLILTVDHVSANGALPLAMMLVSQIDRITELKIDIETACNFLFELLSLTTESSSHAVLMPNLTSWEVEGDNSFDVKGVVVASTVVAPNLTHFKIRSTETCDISYLKASPYLRQIELEVGWLMIDGLSLLSMFAKLESITLIVKEVEFPEDFEPIPLLAPLRHLKTNALCFLHLFAEPAQNIQHLELVPFPSRKYYAAISSYMELITPNRITKLTIHIAGRNRMLSFSKLGKLLALSPLIEHLDIIYHSEHSSSPQFDATTLLRILLKRDLCTRLRSLQLKKIKYEPDIEKKVAEKLASNVSGTGVIQSSVIGTDKVTHEILMFPQRSIAVQATDSTANV